jgi:uncharacterized protein YciI
MRFGEASAVQQKRTGWRAAPGIVGTRGYRAAMAFFAVTMVHGANWDPARGVREQARWDEHAAFMDRLTEEGFVVLGGPLSGGARALLLIEAAGEQEIRARLAADPWEPMGLLHPGTVEPWSTWLGAERAGLPG